MPGARPLREIRARILSIVFRRDEGRRKSGAVGNRDVAGRLGSREADSKIQAAYD